MPSQLRHFAGIESLPAIPLPRRTIHPHCSSGRTISPPHTLIPRHHGRHRQSHTHSAAALQPLPLHPEYRSRVLFSLRCRVPEQLLRRLPILGSSTIPLADQTTVTRSDQPLPLPLPPFPRVPTRQSAHMEDLPTSNSSSHVAEPAHPPIYSSFALCQSFMVPRAGTRMHRPSLKDPKGTGWARAPAW